MINLGVTLESDLLEGLGKRFPRAYRSAMKGMVEVYHREIFPRHFFGSNRSRYKIKPRSQFYLTVIKRVTGRGPGRYVDLLLRGVAARRMKSFATIRAADGGNTMVLRMQAPRYFTNPFIGSYINEHGDRKTITQQPDKVAEVTQVNAEDRTNLGTIFRRKMEAAWSEIKQKKRRRL